MTKKSPKDARADNRGRKMFYEGKKSPVNMTLTEKATQLLDEKAIELGLTRSELVERLARNVIPVMAEAQLLGELQASLRQSA